MHYQKNDKWVDIDNTLQYEEETADTGAGYVNTANDFQVKFAEETGLDQFISIRQGDYGLDWKYIEPDVLIAPVQPEEEFMEAVDTEMPTSEEQTDDTNREGSLSEVTAETITETEISEGASSDITAGEEYTVQDDAATIDEPVVGEEPIVIEEPAATEEPIAAETPQPVETTAVPSITAQSENLGLLSLRSSHTMMTEI